jgi:hypothetical protein
VARGNHGGSSRRRLRAGMRRAPTGAKQGLGSGPATQRTQSVALVRLRRPETPTSGEDALRPQAIQATFSSLPPNTCIAGTLLDGGPLDGWSRSRRSRSKPKCGSQQGLLRPPSPAMESIAGRNLRSRRGRRVHGRLEDPRP